MNNIFKVIWNHATQTWTAVGELASAKGKSKSIKLAAISTALLGSATGVQAATATPTAADKLIAMSVELPAGETTTPQTLEAKATGKNSIAIGVKAEAGANSNIERTIALGYEAQAGTNDSVAIGSGAQVVKATPSTGNTRNARGIAIGSQARIEPKLDGFTVSNGNDDAIAIGTRAIATSGRSIVMGLDASSMRNHNAATYQSGEYTIAIGNNASADWKQSIAIGNYARTFHMDGIAIGNHVTAAGWEGRGAVAIGTQTNAMSFNSIAVGQMTNAKGEGSVAIGREANSHGTNSVSLGISSYTPGNNAIAIGGYAFSGQDRTQRTIAIGDNAHSVWDDNLSLGHNAFSGGNRSNSIGREAVSHGWQALAIGSSEPGSAPSAMAMGDNAASIGTGAFATGWGSIAFGNKAKAGATTDEDINNIKASYNTYRSAYDAYIKADKAFNDKKDNYDVVRTRLSQYATNLKILTGKYYVGQTSTIDGVLAKHRDAFIKALEQAGSSYNELTALADKFEKEPNADKNVAAAKAQKTVIEKFAAIDNTGPGEANEKLAHLVALAKNLKAQLDEEAKLEAGVITAQQTQTEKKAAFTTAENNFKNTYKNENIAKRNALAIGNNSIANSVSSTALGHEAQIYGTSPSAVVIGTSAKAGLTGFSTIEGVRRYGSTDAPNATAVGSSSHVLFEKGSAFGYNNKVRGKSAGAFGVNNIVGENPVWTATGSNTASVSPKEGQSGENSFVVGSNNWVWAKNVMVLGNNVRVYGIGRRLENRENAVVLGNNSDGEPTVKKVNSANVNGMVYSGFKGNLGATKTDGSEAEKADLALQGRFVSIGAPTKKIDKTITIANGKTNTTTVTTNLITGEESTTTASANTKDSDVAGTTTETVYGERQIKHVAAGEISSTSTDAINGSQLYAVASGLRDAFPVVYTDKDGKKLVKYPDGNYYPEGTINIDGQYYPAGTVKIGDKYYPAGTTEDNVGDATEVSQIQPVAKENVIASMNNPSSDAVNAGGNVTLTNVAQGANTIAYDAAGNPLVKVGNSYYAPDQFENGKLKATATPTPTPSTNDAAAATDLVKKAKTGLADLEHSVASNALTVADAKNLGWVVSVGKDGKDYADKVTNANEVRFNGTDGIKVTGETKDGVRHINISLEKGEVVKKGEYNIGGTTYVDIGGKLYKREDVDFSGETPTAKQGKQPSNYTVNTDGKVVDNTSTTPVEVSNVDKGNHFVDGNTVYKAIQESGWTVGKVKNALADSKFQNADEKVNPSDEVRFADGKGITVKTATVDEVNTKGEKQTTTVVKFDTDLPIDYANVKNTAGDNLKQANDGNWYKEADVNNDGTVKLTNNKAPEVQKPVKTGATLSDANSNMGKNLYRTAIEDKAMAAAIEKVRGENPTATVEQLLPKVLEEAAKQVAELEKAEKAGKDKDVINAGKDGVQLNNVGWAENPDQAVNKDQLDQTVNKSGFFVKQNGKTTVENAENKEETDPAKYEKVTPNDVVNFVNGNGTVIKAVTTRDANGVDTTTVSVDVDTSTLSLPKGANTIAYNNDGKQIVNVDGKYYKAGDLTNGKPNTGAVEQTPVTPATDKSVDQAKNGLIDLNNSNGGNAITISDAKNLGWVVSTSDNNVATAVKNADVVDFKAEAGTGLTVKGKPENGKMTVTVGNDYIKANATGEAAKATVPNSVAIGGNSNAAVEDAVAIGNGATVGAEATKGSVAIGAGAKAGKANVGSYSIDPSATVAGKTGPDTRVVSVGDKGNEAQIQNVAPGVISATSTDAVNGSQLHATNVQVNNNAQNINRVEGKVDNLSQVINNHAGEFNRLDRKVNKYGKEARAGIAGANAAAALPQVYTPGKSMVAASAGTFKGQNALAVGYSRASDNGKVILKLQGNANTSGDVGAGVGVGYQW